MDVWFGIFIVLCFKAIVAEGLQSASSRHETCQQLTTFDVVCNHLTSIVVISARPCSSENVYLTSFNTDFGLNTTAPIGDNTSLSLDNDVTLAIDKVVHMDYVSIIDYRKNRVELKLTVKRGTDVKQTLNVTFLMLRKNCFQPKSVSRLANIKTRKAASDCDHIYQLGDFSQSCVVTGNKSGRNITTGLYMTFIDFCTVPFSFNVLSATKELFNVSRYTETKSDVVIPISVTDRSYGLLLDVIVDEKDPTIYNIAMNFNTSDKITYGLTSKKYESGVGMMCPLHHCNYHSDFKKLCRPEWIDYENTTYFSKIYIEYHPCENQIKVNLDISLDNDEWLQFDDRMSLIAYSENDLQNRSHAVPLQLGFFYYERQKGKELYNNGYMLLDGGNITLYASRNISEGWVKITVIRHPISTTAIPILRTEFWVNAEDLEKECSKQKESSSHGLQIGIIIAVVGAILFILVVLAFCCYKQRSRPRRKHRAQKTARKAGGLPYQIHLQGEAEMEDVY